jgi:hypothetical protein
MTTYVIDTLDDGSIARGCRNCDWFHLGGEEQPEHHCRRGPCKHRGERTGAVKLQCCAQGSVRPYTTHTCTIYRACVVAFEPPDREAWLNRKPESDLFALCEGCPDFED